MTIRCHIKLIWGMIIFRPWLALPGLPRLRLPSLFAIREAVEHLSPAKVRMNERGNIKNMILKTSTLDTLIPQGSVASSSCMRIFWRGWRSKSEQKWVQNLHENPEEVRYQNSTEKSSPQQCSLCLPESLARFLFPICSFQVFLVRWLKCFK